MADKNICVAAIKFRDPVWTGPLHGGSTLWTAREHLPPVPGIPTEADPSPPSSPAKAGMLDVTPVGIECFPGILVPWSNIVCLKYGEE